MKNKIQMFIKPGSKLAIQLRTYYHRLQAAPLVNSWHLARAANSYLAWRLNQERTPLPVINPQQIKPEVAFFLHFEPDQFDKTVATIHSLLALISPGWKALLITSEDFQPTLPVKIATDKRVTLFNLAHTNLSCLYDQVSSDYVIHCQPGDIFHESLLDHFYQYHKSLPKADAFYYDCEYQDKNTSQVLPFFKPSAFSPELLLSVNYPSRGFISTSRVLQLAGKSDKNLSLQNRELDLILRLVENNATFQHIPKVLIRQAELSEPVDIQTDVVISSHLERTGRIDPCIARGEHGTRISWKVSNPSVSIIIPSKNNFHLLSNLVESIISEKDYPNYSITIIDNASDNPELLDYYRSLEKHQNVNIVQYDKPFNYSEAINLGVEKTDSELVLLLNNDMKVIDPWWLSELAQWAMRPEIGVVGGKLLRANHTIQHAGIILGMNGFMGHLYLNAPEHYCGLLGSADWYHNLYAVTGACQMVRRELFNKVGGYDENYRLVFGDVDFCLRVHDLGYRNMFTPFARLYHYEGKSRGYKTPIDDILRGYDQMAGRLKDEDPYFSPNLTYNPIPKCQLGHWTINDRMKNIEARRAIMEKGKLE